jgi:hypothetical protein
MTRKELKQLIRESIEEVMNEAPKKNIKITTKHIKKFYGNPAEFETFYPNAMLLVSDAGYVVAEFVVEPSKQKKEKGMYRVAYINYTDPDSTEQDYTSNLTDPMEIYKIDILRTFKYDVHDRLIQLEDEEDYQELKNVKTMIGNGKVKVYKRPTSDDYIWNK